MVIIIIIIININDNGISIMYITPASVSQSRQSYQSWNIQTACR